MIEIVLYYIGIGFLMNLVPALFVFYKGQEKGYVMIPHPMIFFMTIFSWPLTLWNYIERFTGKKKDEE